MTYKGDTPSKKIARSIFWQSLAEFYGEDIFPKCGFLFLASHEGGDASVLKALGVPACNMCAADSDPAALERFSAKHPDVPTYQGDVRDVLESSPVPNRGALGIPSFIHLDFCSTMGTKIAETIVHAARKVANGGVVSWVYQRARDRPNAMKVFRAHKSAAILRAFEYGKAFGSTGEIEARIADQDNDGREQFLLSRLRRDGERCFYWPGYLFAISYVSRIDGGGPGTPMELGAAMILRSDARSSEPMNRTRFKKRVRPSLALSFLALKERFDALPAGGSRILGEANEADVLRYVDLCIEDGDSVEYICGCLNLSLHELAAYRAHRTRGTPSYCTGTMVKDDEPEIPKVGFYARS